MSDADNRPAVVGQVERPVGPHAQLVERLQDEAGLCRNEGADDIAALLEEAAAALDAQADNIEWRDEGAADNLRRVAGHCRLQERDARAAIARATA